MANLQKYLPLPRTPRWNVGEGLIYPSPTVPKDGPTPMSRWHPTINTVCERLLGASSCYLDDGEIKWGRARYLGFDEAMLVYREGLELIAVFKERSDLLSLAMFRRQVTVEGDISLDGLFLELAEEFDPPLTPEEWGDLAVRMPQNSWILATCLVRSQGSGRHPLLADAAE